jgi:hypothetical protein
MPTTRLLSLDEYPLAAEFLHRHWAPNHIYSVNKSLFDWTFNHPQINQPGTYSFAVAEQEGRVVGVLGGIPFSFNDRGQQRRAFWLANWKMLEEFRRGTAALALLDYFYAPPHQVTISFGINPTVARLYDAMRWHVMDNIPRYFAVHPARSKEFADLLRLANPAWPAHKGNEMANAFLADPAPATTIATFAPPVRDEWNQRSWEPLKLELTGAARDGDYLYWRYVQHPLFQYRFIQIEDPSAARSASQIGLLIWRLETVRHKVADQLHDVGKIGRIVEFLPTSPGNAKDLLSHFWQVLDGTGAFGCDCYLYHGRFGQWIANGGLHRLDDHPDGVAVPSRFQPLDAAGGQIRSAVSLRTPPFPVYPYATDCMWYWTKSDSDQDRPN